MDKDLIVSGFIQINDEIISTDDMVPLPERSGSTCCCFMLRHHGKRYLMKRLCPEFAGNPRYQELFRKEFETGQRLTHEHLVKYVSMGEDIDGCYIIMEYVDGDTLGERMRKNPDYFASSKHVSRLFTQLLSCLTTLHHHQVLHLDLKPDNIMLTRISDDVKLIDLGFCYSDSYDMTMGLNPFYSAPEQQEGQLDRINVCTDLYAVGLLFRDVTLLHPNLYDTKAIMEVIARSTQSDPCQRYSTAAEMAMAIREALFDGKKAGEKSKRRNVWIAIAMLQGVVVLLAGAFIWSLLAHFLTREPELSFYDSHGMHYQILSSDSLTCTVSGRDYTKSLYSAEHTHVHPFASHEEHYYRVLMVNDSAFFADTVIQTLSISEGVVRMAPFACSQCPNLHSVTLPRSITSIGRNTFQECPNLEHIVLPPGIRRLGNESFMGCTSLSWIHFPEGLESIGKDCFASSGLTSAQLPSSLLSLERGVFYGCRSLRSVTLPAALERIGDFCFHHCDSLLEVRNLSTTPQPITDIFSDTIGLQRILYVPRQSIDLYRNAPYWSEFSQILPLE